VLIVVPGLTLKVLRRGSQFYLQLHQCLLLPRKHSPDGTSKLRWWSSNCSLLLTYLPRKDERLSWLDWLTYSRQFTHISMVTHQLQVKHRTEKVRRSKTKHSTTVPHNQPTVLCNQPVHYVKQFLLCRINHLTIKMF